MIDIKLNEEQNGYDVISEYIKKFWKHHPENTVVVSFSISSDGVDYTPLSEVTYPYWNGIEFLNDWWEGEEYIHLFGIIDIMDIENFEDIDNE